MKAFTLVSLTLWTPSQTIAEVLVLNPLTAAASKSIGPVMLFENKLILSDGRSLLLKPNQVDNNKQESDHLEYEILSDNHERQIISDLCGATLSKLTVSPPNYDSIVEITVETEGDMSSLSDDCNDLKYFSSTSQNLSQEAPGSIDEWEVVEGVPPEGGYSYAIAIDSESANDEGNPYTLVVECRNNKTNLYVLFKKELSGSHLMTLIDVPGKKKSMEFWPLIYDNSVAVSEKWPGSLLKKMLDSERVHLNFAEQGRTDFDVTFVLPDLRRYLSPLAQKCNWEL